VVPEVSALVANVVDRALAFNKAMRWPDARRMQESVRHAYHARTGASIATAPRLTVPESVENRTLPAHDALSRGLPTTVRPVARASTRFLGDKPRSVQALAAAGVVAATVGVVVAVSGLVRARSTPERMPAPAASEEAPQGAIPPPVTIPPVVVPAAAEPGVAETTVESLPPLPEVAATDLPSAAPPPTAPPAAAGAKPLGSGPAGKGNCSPPYVINPATGKKNWKVECL
jgi:serine/threonine-protein kinase